MTAHRLLAVVGAAAVLAAAPGSLAGQIVRGVVADISDRPVAGIIVALVDASSREIARALTNERGEYRLSAPADGAYRIRTMRIGFRSSTSEVVMLTKAQDITRRITVSAVAVMLDTIRARDRNACHVVARDSGRTIFAAWEQVRNALMATQISSGDRTIIATTMGYTQMLDVMRNHVGSQTSDIRSDFLRQPWRSLMPDSLRKSGYVVTEAGDIRTYHAPGIDVLLSEQFLSDHCLRIAEGSNDQRLGIAFEPTPDRSKIAEIRGTLWLDRATAELRNLEYRYVNISRDEERVAGGDMSFIRMRNGMWAISRWKIRMPTIVLVPIYRGLIVTNYEQRVDSISIQGGELVAAVAPGSGRRDTLWSRPPVILSGLVLDSLTGRGVPRAIVALPATKQADTTDANGRFAIRNMLPGRYTLDIRTPSLDSARMSHQVPVLFTDSSLAVRVRVPNAAQIAGSVCPGIDISRRTPAIGIIVGSIMISGDTIASANVPVTAEWQAFTVQTQSERSTGTERFTPGATFASHRQSLRAQTDASGTFRLCGVPTMTNLVVQAIVDSSTHDFKRVRLPDAERFGRLDFTIDRGRSAFAEFIGIVTDSAQAPLADAEVMLPEIGLSSRSDARGRFHIGGILPGNYRLVVRRVGFGPLETALDFAPATATNRTIVLMRITVLDSVVTSARPYRDLNLDEFEERRRIGTGSFVTRAEIEKREGALLSSFLRQMPQLRIATAQGGEWPITGTTRFCTAAVPPGQTPGAMCEVIYVPSISEARSGVPTACFAKVYLDNALMNSGTPTPPFNLRDIPTPQVEAIEYYARPSELPAKYAHLNSACGVIIIHTRRPR